MVGHVHNYYNYMPGEKPDLPVTFLCGASPSPLRAYRRLPQQHLKLSVLKLNGSCFEVEVAMMAKVAELKQAVEDVFSHSPPDKHLKISWSHVWGHFCLCYEGQKLVDDKAFIRSFGIKDGDQICFVRHLANNNKPANRRAKERNAAYQEFMVAYEC